MSETYSTEGPQCPHCARQYTADEPHYYSDSYTQDECDSCGKTFKVEVYTSTSWTCEAIEASPHSSTMRETPCP